MELVDSVFFSKIKEVPSLITFWILIINTSCSMERLMNITNIMNKVSQRNWFANISGIRCFAILHDSLVYIGELKSWISSQPRDDFRNCLCNVMLIFNKTCEICLISTLVKIWLINKVPWDIVSASFSIFLYLISESCTFNKRIISLPRKIGCCWAQNF